MYVCMSTPNQAGALASQGHNATAEPTPVMQPDVPKLTPNTRLSTVGHFFEERLLRHTNQVRTVELAERRANDEPARRAEPGLNTAGCSPNDSGCNTELSEIGPKYPRTKGRRPPDAHMCGSGRETSAIVSMSKNTAPGRWPSLNSSLPLRSPPRCQDASTKWIASGDLANAFFTLRIVRRRGGRGDACCVCCCCLLLLCRS